MYGHSNKAIEQYFLAVLFIMLYKLLPVTLSRLMKTLSVTVQVKTIEHGAICFQYFTNI